MVLDEIITLEYTESFVDEVGGISMTQKGSMDIFCHVEQKQSKLMLQNGQMRDFTEYEITIRQTDATLFNTAQRIKYKDVTLKAKGKVKPTREAFTTLKAVEG